MESRSRPDRDDIDAGSDDQLWEIARDGHLSPAAAAHLEELNQKDGRDGLTAEEQRMIGALLQQYERLMLMRAEALPRLKEHGRDVSRLLNTRSV